MAYEILSWTALKEAWKQQQLQMNSDHSVGDIKELERYGDVKFINTYIAHLDSLSVDYSDDQKADCLSGVMLTVRKMVYDDYPRLNPKGGILNKGSSLFRALDTILKPEDKKNPMDPVTAYRILNTAHQSFSAEIYEAGDELKGKKTDHKFVIQDDRAGKEGVIFKHLEFGTTLIALKNQAHSEKDQLQNEINRKAKLEEEKRAREEALKAKGGNSGILSSITGGLSHMFLGGGKASASTSKSSVAEEEFVPEGPST
ncbi:hypothetical protein [Legionella genomosp. 1]|uniref:hypothetical protein n=1 Tax=Legionella genomosp. 1 TaxID=1093625 RepID=UPI0013EF9F89|nr:hypothetical protein [Legionella genomosp. 1]